MNSVKVWVKGQIAENIDRDFITIRDCYKEQGVYYTREAFYYELKEAIFTTEVVFDNMLGWYEKNVVLETNKIIQRLVITR